MNSASNVDKTLNLTVIRVQKYILQQLFQCCFRAVSLQLTLRKNPMILHLKNRTLFQSILPFSNLYNNRLSLLCVQCLYKDDFIRKE